MYAGNKRKKLWREEKERLLKMTLEERRKEYSRQYVPLKDIPTWMEDIKSKNESESTKEEAQGKRSLSEKVSLYRGDITLLEVDAIVNAGRPMSTTEVKNCLVGPCDKRLQRCVRGTEIDQVMVLLMYYVTIN
uniref:MACD2 deacetylase n=1 Tax=Nothoprocta perdicaria TaxID=30464 RepID=A0A8C6Z2T8_NOTPE